MRKGLPPNADAKWAAWCVNHILEHDKNHSNKLEKTEWLDSHGDFDLIDTNNDGGIDLSEYYSYRISRHEESKP